MSGMEKRATTLKTLSAASFSSSGDAPRIAVVRCILAFSGLIIIHFDHAGTANLTMLANISLMLYCIWSAILLLIVSPGSAPTLPPRYTHWGDVLFSSFLVALTQGASSIFVLLFLFAILAASFSRGFREGLLVTGASTVLFGLVGVWFALETELELDQILVRPVYLLALGYMIAYWGGNEIDQRRRLGILQLINNNHWNPRFGYDHAIAINLERMLYFFEAKSCVLILKRANSAATYAYYYAAQNTPGQATLPNELNEAAAKSFLGLSDDIVTLYTRQPVWWERITAALFHKDPVVINECKGLADILDTHCFITAPFVQRDGDTGRVFITSGGKPWTDADIVFAGQLTALIAQVVESMQLMDDLVSKAAEHERNRISLDIHDTTVQPYIGLKLGLEALYRQAGTDNPLSEEIGELLAMTQSTIQDLRRHAINLREGTSLTGDTFVSAAKSQAEHFERFYGVIVEVKCDTDLRVSAKLAGAALQILAEGMSNILRHTKARKAYIEMHCDDQKLFLKIANEITGRTPVADFIPRSISARALLLGGTSFVTHNVQGYTVVHVVIPL
jgi:signal transduction histidine kinase